MCADRAAPIHENLQYDLYYIEQQSLFLDLAVMLSTILFAACGVGAYGGRVVLGLGG